MTGVDRVALVAWLWFIFWVFALSTVWTWPWVMPESLDDWMYDPRA